MGLGGLQHYTIEPSDLERTKDFYCDVLGLENGDRPPLDFPGYWLYSGGTATVHLIGTRKPREGIVVRGTEKKYEDTGRLDHIAFAATDVDGMRKRLQSKDVKFRESIVVGFWNGSDNDIAGISTGNPPEDHTPRLTSSTRCLKCV